MVTKSDGKPAESLQVDWVVPACNWLPGWCGSFSSLRLTITIHRFKMLQRGEISRRILLLFHTNDTSREENCESKLLNHTYSITCGDFHHLTAKIKLLSY